MFESEGDKTMDRKTTNVAVIREALTDPAIAKYPDFIKVISDAMDEIESLRIDLGLKPPNVEGSPLLEWAVSKWNEEVKNRPLVNVHRRTLDDTWRQVIRWAGGDPGELVGPSHDELLSQR